jgi:ribonuclease HI
MKNKKTFVVFTDGGCDAISKIGASALIIIDPDIDDIIYEWSDAFKNTTNNRMELIAFKEALTNLKREKNYR